MAASEFVRATKSFMAIHDLERDRWRIAPPGLAKLESYEMEEHVHRGDILATYNTLPMKFPEFFEAIPADSAPGATAGRRA